MTTDGQRLLFVCTANICRSPWAEHRARVLLPSWRVGSAGVLARDGDAFDPVMRETLTSEPIEHRSRRLGPALVLDATLILTMEQAHRERIVDDWPTVVRRVFTLRQFVDTLAVAPELDSLDELLSWCYRHRVPATGDVSDPFGRGSAAARATAEQLESLLTVLATRLEPTALGD